MGLHRLVVRERLLGLARRRLDVPWEDIHSARVDGGHLTVVRADGRAVHTAVRGTPGQVAWIAGHIHERVRRAALPEPEARQLREERLRLIGLLRHGATVTDTP